MLTAAVLYAGGVGGTSGCSGLRDWVTFIGQFEMTSEGAHVADLKNHGER